jgi:signal transduction histidine kinase
MASEDSYPALISLAVHELRSPANVVWGYLKMLKHDRQSTLGAHERHLVDEAEKSCARLAELMTELSDVGKLDAGEARMAHRRVDFFGLVREVAAGLHEGEDRGVRIDVRGQSTDAIVEGDPDRLRPALAAVIRSVAREQPGPCTIVVDRQRKATANSSTAVVVVTNEARGHEADAESAAFDDKRGGLGLALPIARRVIEAHGGQLRSRIGGGVTISVPLAI